MRNPAASLTHHLARLLWSVAWLLLFIGASVPPLLHAAPLPAHWRWSNPTPHGGNIFDMTYGLGLTVEVAERGQIYTSDDLLLWEPRESNTTNSLRAVTFFGERLVITGEKGTVLWADSLDEFHLLNLNTVDWLEGVTSSTNLLMAVGDNGAIYTSTNSVNWQRQSAGITNGLSSVAYALGTFVAVGENGLIATSANGTSWTKRTSGTARNLKRVVWINDRFWVVGDAGVTLTSPAGGIAWTPVTTGATNPLYSVEGALDTRLAVGDSEVRLRDGGATWLNQYAWSNYFSPPRWTYYNALWEGSLHFISGRSGMMVEGFQTNATSPYFWVQRAQPIRNWLWELLRTPDFYVTVGYLGTVLTSGNGIDWDLELVPDSVTNTVFLGVGGTTNLLIAVGDKGSVILSPNTLSDVVFTNSDNTLITNQASTLGVIWSAVPRPTTNDLQGVAVFGDQYVLTGNMGTILTSANGTNWTKRPTPTTAFLSGVTAHPGGLVAVGQGGVLLTSPEGTNWTQRATGTTNWIYRVRYLGGKFIAVGQNGTILISVNATNWTAASSGTIRWLNDVTLLADTYFTVGTQGTVLASTNAVSWTNIGTITEKSLYGVACHDGQLVAAGVEGAIVRSQVIRDLTPVQFLKFGRTNNQNLFLFAGKPDQHFTLDSSTMVTNWSTGSQLEFLDSSGTLLFLQSASTNTPASQFFRATLTP